MNILKSIGAVLAGIIFIVASHSATDLVLEKLGIFPPRIRGFILRGWLWLPLLPQHSYGSGRLPDSSPGSGTANATCNGSRNNWDCGKYDRGNRHQTDGTSACVVSDRTNRARSSLYVVRRKVENEVTKPGLQNYSSFDREH